MSTTSFPARHEAIRRVLIERGYTHYTADVWSHPSNGMVVSLPMLPFADYDEECEHIEIRLGMRLPPEVQRAVDAERARCLAIVAAHRERAEQIENDDRRFRVDRIKAHDHIECCDVIAKAIESGEVTR